MLTRFLLSPRLIVRYTMGECGDLAKILAKKLRVNIVGVGSPEIEEFSIPTHINGELVFISARNPMQILVNIYLWSVRV